MLPTMKIALTWIRAQLVTSEVARHVATALVAFILGAILF